MCTLRLRLCYDRKDCPLCKAELKEVRVLGGGGFFWDVGLAGALAWGWPCDWGAAVHWQEEGQRAAAGQGRAVKGRAVKGRARFVVYRNAH